LRVLLVASEARARNEIHTWIESEGFEVRAVDQLKADSGPADVIVLMLQATLDEGAKWCRDARKRFDGEPGMVLALGSWKSRAEVRALFQSGADDYLGWPFDARTLGLRLMSLEESIKRRPSGEDPKRLEERLAATNKGELLMTLAGGIAHDFNNLLSAILGNAELALLSLPAGAKVRHNIEQIEKVSQRAAELTRQMLAYSGKPPAEYQPLSLTELVEEMSELLRVSISRRNTIRYDFLRPAPPIRGDASQLRQVVMNLLINASEAMDESGGTIHVRTAIEEIRPDSGADGWIERPVNGQYVMLEVSDTGCGICKDNLTKIFDPFFSTKKDGRGLGLAGTQAIVRKHHGAMRVMSQRGAGSVFQVLLPVAQCFMCGADLGEEVDADWTGEGTVLLVEDEEAVREAAQFLLEKAGYVVLAASTGEMGVEVFRELKDEIQAVILDVSMPGMDGLEVLRIIKSMRPDTHVIVWTGFDEQDVADELRKHGVDAFLEKPAQVKELARVLKSVLRQPTGPV
jgi:two-component system cell cycle sensor histidine kinase/response regulator CckA